MDCSPPRLILAAGFFTAPLTGWNLTGSSGASRNNCLGTIDALPLELRVDGARAMRLEPTSDTPNVIGGFSGNYAQAGLPGVTIGGGGTAINNQPNAVTNNGYYATIAGGYHNSVGGYGGAVLGGSVNDASGNFSTTGGGQFHTALGSYSTVAGGYSNFASNDGTTGSGGSGEVGNGLAAFCGGRVGAVPA